MERGADVTSSIKRHGLLINDNRITSFGSSLRVSHLSPRRWNEVLM
jgi:hypothetical protein